MSICCHAALAGSGCPDGHVSDEAASRWLAEANSAYESGNFATAETRWGQIYFCARGTRDWPKAVYNLGFLEHERKHLGQAITYFKQVIDSHPNDKEAGGSLMETNRNYSHRSAIAISRCYEEMGDYGAALHYAWLAKRKYVFYSWCGTCLAEANLAVSKRIAYLAMRTSRVHILSAVLVFGFVALRRSGKRRRLP